MTIFLFKYHYVKNECSYKDLQWILIDKIIGFISLFI